MDEFELDWQTYEQVVKNVYEQLGKGNGVKILGYGHKCTVTGKSNVSHQIDVLTSHTDGIHTYQTAIECKFWKERVTKDTVTKVAHIIEDAGLHKGVIVSKEGFTDDAISTAKYRNIGLVELREIREHDLSGRPRVFSITATVLRPEIIKIIVHPSLFNTPAISSAEIQVSNTEVIANSGEKISFKTYLDSFKEKLRTHSANEIVNEQIVLPMARLVNKKTGSELYIDRIIFKGRLLELPGPKFFPEDEVWLIMKVLFEEQSFTISKKGVIRKDR